ncbi:MAG: TonB system transport protein ExbD [Phyllobacterium sp.]
MAGGIRERAGGDELEENHEINVTPFIDVMLVLLIIFMVAAPLATVDVNVDLPASTAKPAERPDKPLYLTVKGDLSLNLGDDSIQRETLGASLDAFTQNDKETRVFLRADKQVAYGDLMDVMNMLRSAGYLKIALVGLESFAPSDTSGQPSAGAGSVPAQSPSQVSGQETRATP